MKTINLRWIYPHYRHDEFVEVSDEVWEAMRQAQREMNNYERRKVYHRAWYSLDAYSWAEKLRAGTRQIAGGNPFGSVRNGPARLRLVAALRKPWPMPPPPRPVVSGPTTLPVSTSRKLPGWRAYTAARSVLPSAGSAEYAPLL